ncbi:MAG: hypothetical protein Q8Q09_05350 [Deltaproteobacteria bacterium]|nr:hypothetical protein [Deltaproteobacteria bacterium]
MTEASCPFCARSLGGHAVTQPRDGWQSIRSRAALAAFSAVTTACGASMQQDPANQPTIMQQQEPIVVHQHQQEPTVIQQQPVTEAPPQQPNTIITVRPAQQQTQPVVTPQPDYGNAVPAYGIAPYNPADNGAAVARYGAPPAPTDY